MALTLNDLTGGSKKEARVVKLTKTLVSEINSKYKDGSSQKMGGGKPSQHRPWQVTEGLKSERKNVGVSKTKKQPASTVGKVIGAGAAKVQREVANRQSSTIQSTKKWMESVSIFPKLSIPVPKFLLHKERK